MTHTSTEQPELLPCPFCGSHLVSQSIGHTGEGNPFPYIECEECAAFADPAFWNRRVPAPQAQRVPLSDAEIRRAANAAFKDGTLDWHTVQRAANGVDFEPYILQSHFDIIRVVERAHGITQEKQG